MAGSPKPIQQRSVVFGVELWSLLLTPRVLMFRSKPLEILWAKPAQALLRPGRFDRQISIDRPDITGREQIFCVYLEKLKLDKGIKHYSERMAALTPGPFSSDVASQGTRAWWDASGFHVTIAFATFRGQIVYGE